MDRTTGREEIATMLVKFSARATGYALLVQSDKGAVRRTAEWSVRSKTRQIDLGGPDCDFSADGNDAVVDAVMAVFGGDEPSLNVGSWFPLGERMHLAQPNPSTLILTRENPPEFVGDDPKKDQLILMIDESFGLMMRDLPE
jgi:hypothetical protein